MFIIKSTKTGRERPCTISVLKKLFVFLFLVISTTSFSQSTKDDIRIKGIVIDSLTQDAIGYATVVLVGDSSKMINAVPSDVNGKFTIKAPRQENYKIRVGFVGYGTKTVDVNLTTDDTIEVGTIALTEGVMASDVNVIAYAPLITSDADKITYNMEADPEAATSSTFEILRKVPMLSIDGDDNVRLNGETNYKVLVNGRSSTMMSKNFKDVIKSMPASSIKNIEVITNPSTKYDSEGIGGIINIITTKQRIRGFNGSANLGIDNRGSINLGTYIAAQVGKFAISANISAGEYINNGSTSYNETENFLSNDYKYSISEGVSGKSRNKNGHSSIEASYEIDSLNLITLSGWGYLGNYKNDSHSTTQFHDIDDILSRQFTNKLNTNGGYGSLSASLNYQKLFMKKDKSLTISYNIDNSPQSSDFTTEIDGILDYDSYLQHSENDAIGNEHTAQVDFYNPINDNHQYEGGIKYILRTNVSDTKVEEFDHNNNLWENTPEKVNDLDYDQHIGSLYGGYVFKHKKFTARGGIRGEITFNDGVSKSSNGNVALETEPLFNVVPYVNLSYQLKKGQNIYFAYTQRIQRPSIWYLNPYINDSDPINIRTGNPDLESVVANSFSFNYRKSAQKWNLFTGLSASLADNSIVSISSVDEKGIKTSTYDNIGENNNYRFNTSGSYRLGVKLNVYANGYLAYTDIRSKNNDLSNSGFSYGGSLGGSVRLWKEANFNANGGYYSSRIQLQGKGSSYFYHSLGLSQKLLKKKTLTLSLSVSNPFKENMSHESHLMDKTFKTFSSYTYQIRSFRFGINYRFGKMNTQVKKTRRSITNDDKMGGGGGSGGGGAQGGGA